MHFYLLLSCTTTIKDLICNTIYSLLYWFTLFLEFYVPFFFLFQIFPARALSNYVERVNIYQRKMAPPTKQAESETEANVNQQSSSSFSEGVEDEQVATTPTTTSNDLKKPVKQVVNTPAITKRRQATRNIIIQSPTDQFFSPISKKLLKKRQED